jgi:hypothetical protein
VYHIVSLAYLLVDIHAVNMSRCNPEIITFSWHKSSISVSNGIHYKQISAEYLQDHAQKSWKLVQNDSGCSPTGATDCMHQSSETSYTWRTLKQPTEWLAKKPRIKGNRTSLHPNLSIGMQICIWSRQKTSSSDHVWVGEDLWEMMGQLKTI